jgi:DNA-binding transcriptional MerR regulator
LKPADAAKLLGVSASALRTWSIDEFKEYLSPSGQGGDGRYRDFTEVDLRVLNLINEMKKASKPLEEIHITLRALQSGNWERLPSLPQRAMTGSTMGQPDSGDSERSRALLQEIALYREQRDELQAQLDQERQANEQLLRELADKERKIGELSTLVRLYEEGRLKPDRKKPDGSIS